MKPVSTIDLVMAVIQVLKLAFDFFSKEKIKNDKHIYQKPKDEKPVYNNDAKSVVDQFLGRK
jgi:hypothetical protein